MIADTSAPTKDNAAMPVMPAVNAMPVNRFMIDVIAAIGNLFLVVDRCACDEKEKEKGIKKNTDL